MQITEKRIHIDSNWFSAEREVKRSKGLHLSHVIDFIESQEGQKRGGVLTPDGHAYAGCGFLWEHVLQRLVEYSPTELFEWMFTGVLNDIPNPKIVRPGEVCLDGINMTPDGIYVGDAPELYLEEWKYTTKSSKHGLAKSRRWIDYQIPSYLKALDLLKCRLRVLYARGDYTTGVPEFWEFLIEYTQQEIDEIWDVILRNAAYMRSHGLVELK